MLSLLKASSLRRFFLAHFQSELGTGAAYVALMLVAYHRLHSGWAISLVLLADFVPGIVLGAPLGALADRLPRRRIMIGADLLRAGAFVGLAAIPSFGATVALALLAGVGTTMYRTTVNAALPGMVSVQQRSPATALYGMNFSIGMTVGPALTALVLLFAPATVVLAANGVTFLVSAAVLRTLRIDRDAASPARSDSESERTSLWSSTVDGVRSARRIPGVSMLLFIGGASVLAGASVNRLRRWLVIGMVVQGAGMLGSAAVPNMSFATVSFALTGTGNGLLAGPEVRLLQELASERLLGRVFGLRDTLINSAYVLAFVSAGAVLAALGVQAIFAFGGIGLLALATAGWLGFRPRRSGDALPALAETA